MTPKERAIKYLSEELEDMITPRTWMYIEKAIDIALQEQAKQIFKEIESLDKIDDRAEEMGITRVRFKKLKEKFTLIK